MVIINKERVRIGAVLLFLAAVAVGMGIVAVRTHRLRIDPAVPELHALISESRAAARRVAARLSREHALHGMSSVSVVEWGLPEAPSTHEKPAVPDSVSDLPLLAVDEVIHLTGIAWNEQRPLAFVNGSVCAEGDQVGRFSVRRVLRDRMTVADPEGVEHVVLLYKESAGSQ